MALLARMLVAVQMGGRAPAPGWGDLEWATSCNNAAVDDERHGTHNTHCGPRCGMVHDNFVVRVSRMLVSRMLIAVQIGCPGVRQGPK